MPRSIFTIGVLPDVSVEALYVNQANIEKARRLIQALPEIETHITEYMMEEKKKYKNRDEDED